MKSHVDSVLTDQVGFAKTALRDLQRLRKFSAYIERHRGGDSNIDLDTLQQHLEDVETGRTSSHSVEASIEEQIAELELLKSWLLNEDLLDELTAEMSSEPPYLKAQAVAQGQADSSST
jgi:hypothetical protein